MARSPLVTLPLALLLLAAAPATSAVTYNIDGGLLNGGDCPRIGTWNAATQTCHVPSLILGARGFGDTLIVVAATCEIGTLINGGTIQDFATLRVLDEFTNVGGVSVGAAATLELMAGCVGDNGGTVTLESMDSVLLNRGVLTNSGLIDKPPWVAGNLVNEGTLTNLGEIDVRQFDNNGTAYNDGGALDGFLANNGTLDFLGGGDVFESQVFNHGVTYISADAYFDGFDNSGGTLVIRDDVEMHLQYHLDNSGIIQIDGTLKSISSVVNYGLIQVDGNLGSSNVLPLGLFVYNQGLIVIDGGATLTDFTNGADGILLNSGGVHLRERGIDNFGFIRNGADARIRYEWTLTNHLGAFIENAGELEALQHPPSRPYPLNNLSTIVNLCGGVITGEQILVGNPPLVGLELRLDPSGPEHLQWCTAPGILSYDVVQGDLAGLLAGGGDFTQATTGCLADQSDGPGSFAPDPGPGVGFWFLVRSDGASYDSNYPSQAASRDAGIAASGMACP